VRFGHLAVAGQQDRGASVLSGSAHQRVARRLAVAAAGLALLSLLGWQLGLLDRLSHQEGRIVHGEGDGILSASVDRGGNGLSRPPGLARTERWRGSFGAPLLCLKDESAGPARVERVRYDFRVRPTGSHTWVRTVPDLSDQHPGAPADWAPFSGLVGSPGAFRSAVVRGEFARFEEDLMITDPCREGAVEFSELVTVLETRDGGAWSSGVLIDYTADGQDYTLRVPWEMVLCGARTEAFCRDAGPAG
jgi:hypothetical protein